MTSGANSRDLRLGPFEPVNCVAFDRSGARLATGSHDRYARLFDSATGAELLSARHPDNVLQVALSPDGLLLATGTANGLVRVLDTQTSAELARVEPARDDGIATMAFSPDGAMVAYGTRRGGLRVIEARTGASLRSVDRRDEVTAVEFSPDGSRLVAAAYDGAAVVLTLGSDSGMTEVRGYPPEPFRRNTRPAPAFRDATFSPDGDLIAFGGHDADTSRGWAHVASTDGQMIADWLDEEDYVSSVAFCLDGQALAIASGPFVRVNDIHSRSSRWGSWRFTHEGLVWQVRSSPDGTMLATACHDGTAWLIDADTGRQTTRFEHDGPVTTVAFRPDGRAFATGSWDGYARVFAVS
jgi:WD40 repeat protein